MSISTTNYYRVFLLIAVGFYLSFFRFFERVITGAGDSASFEVVAGGNILNQIIGILLLLLSLTYFLTSKLQGIKAFLMSAWPILLIVCFFLLSITWSDVPNITFRRCVAFFTLIISTFVLAQVFSPRSLLYFLANAIALATIVGLFYTFLSGSTINFGLGERESGFRGMFADKNSAARIYAYGLLLFCALGRYRTGWDRSLLALLTLALFASQSASAVVIAVVGVGLTIALRIFRGRNKSESILRFIMLVLLLMIAGLVIINLYEYLLSLLGRDANLTNRAIIWELLKPYLEEKYLYGYGFGSFWASSAVADFIERWGFIGNAHSGYFEIMLHAGVVGMGLFFVLIFVNAARAIKLYIGSEHRIFASFAITLLSVQLITNYIGYIILNHNSFDMFLFMLCFFCVANLVGSHEYNKS
ncbi:MULTISPECIES: O-antigen ligase family protein [Alteromonadaceae]|uniref:O-antigen ligase family protein n=1 Tax=Brumicola blandensis TaxID=3075611 RepID=A0AAW8RA53_9ALTE|nr:MULTISPECIES: O-antigen ligase family protein [unclassified Alteromonas]MDT0584068.1 O-antigen ligase family protein [Alteromonas sp. W409]MDT0628981.1 O-antigen ligase family protein [Alteromonas sp. W364]